MRPLHERLQQTYRPNFRPADLGPNYKPAPQRDIFGNRPATPVEIQRAVRGNQTVPEQQPISEKQQNFRKKGRNFKK